MDETSSTKKSKTEENEARADNRVHGRAPMDHPAQVGQQCGTAGRAGWHHRATWQCHLA